jgi:hypothetical protein
MALADGRKMDLMTLRRIVLASLIAGVVSFVLAFISAAIAFQAAGDPDPLRSGILAATSLGFAPLAPEGGGATTAVFLRAFLVCLIAHAASIGVFMVSAPLWALARLARSLARAAGGSPPS